MSFYFTGINALRLLILGCMVFTLKFLILRNVFIKCLNNFSFLPATYEWSNFFSSLWAFSFIDYFLILIILVDMWWYLTFLIFISLMTSYVELTEWTYLPPIYPLQWNIIKSFAYFLIVLFEILLLSFQSSLHVLASIVW